MIGKLTDDQIDLVIRTNTVGRIGCHAGGRVYIVPITYVYDGNCIYAHSKEGLKIDMMRKNPYVCFEVDSMENMAAWRSVIAWGRYEELKTSGAQQKGIKLLTDRLLPLVASSTTRQPAGQPPHIVEKKKKAIIFRIKLKEKTGRFEKP